MSRDLLRISRLGDALRALDQGWFSIDSPFSDERTEKFLPLSWGRLEPVPIGKAMWPNHLDLVKFIGRGEDRTAIPFSEGRLPYWRHEAGQVYSADVRHLWIVDDAGPGISVLDIAGDRPIRDRAQSLLATARIVSGERAGRAPG